MMRNICLISILTVLLCAACTPSPISPSINISLSKYNVEEHCLSTESEQISIQIHNTNNIDIDIEWKHNKDQTQTGWSYTINNSMTNTGTITIPANTSANLLLTVSPNGNIGKGRGVLKFSDAANPSVVLQECIYNLTSIASYFRIAQGTPMMGSVPVTTVPDYDYSIWLINDNSIPIDVQWARTNEVHPTAWKIIAKTSMICYLPEIMTDDLTIPANDSVPFKLMFDHQNTIGNGRSIPIFWVQEDSINSVKNEVVAHGVTL